MALTPEEEFERLAAQYSRQVSTTPSPAPSGGPGGSRPRHRVKMDAFGAGVLGAADTITFGYLDEAGSFLDSHLPTWLGGTGETYEQALRRNRDILDQAREEHGTAFLVGNLAGGFVPFLGWGGRVKNAVTAGRLLSLSEVGSMARAGLVQGALYGSGSADGDLTDRMLGAATGGVVGGFGGALLGATVVPAARWGGQKAAMVFRWGKPFRFEPTFKPRPVEGQTTRAAEDLTALSRETGAVPKAPKVAREEPQVAPAGAAKAEPKRFNDLTGAADDVLEDGAIVTSKELFGMNREAAKRAILDRVSKLTPQQAERLAYQLEDAELNGKIVDNPQYRSLLGIDLSDTDMDEATMLQAAELFEEATGALIEKAGLKRDMTAAGITRDLKQQYGDFISEAELDEAVERSAYYTTDSRIGSLHMAMAAIQFARAKDKWLPQIIQGNREAREKLAEELSKSIRLSAKGRLIASRLGGGLGDMARARKLTFAEETPEGAIQLESPEEIRKKVDAAMDALGDSDLAELLTRVRSLDNLQEVEEVLLNADQAQELSNYRRAMNSLSAFLKSNSLTPASGFFNTVGFVMHDLFRNQWAKQWAARNFELAGAADEALKLRFEVSVQNHVYWEAHRRGLKAMVQRIKWEALDSLEKVFGVASADNKVALKASASKLAMMADGFQPPALRQDFRQANRAAVTDIRGFNQRMDELTSGGGAFANLYAFLYRTGAVALNATDALGTATAKLVSGALDDWGGTFVRVKETYALAARHAINEALTSGLPEDELVQFAQRRAQQLAEMPNSDILQQVSDKLMKREALDATDHFLVSMADTADKEARAVLFSDGPQTDFGQKAAALAQKVDKAVSFGTIEGLLVRYIRTPTRIFERGIVHYTPWGAKAREVKDILERGGVEAEIERARMEVGTFVMGLGAMAAASGAITLTNGGYKNSRNLTGEPPNRLNLPGGAYVELGRMDPFALTLALGGFIGQAVKSYRDDRKNGYEAEEALYTAMDIGWLAIRESVFEKSYMTGLRDLMKAMSDDGSKAANAVTKLLEGAVTNIAPFAGTVRQVNDTLHGTAPEAVSWMDKMFRAVPGMGMRLPSRIDPLGDPVDGRFMGVQTGVANTGKDPVRDQLADLGIDISELGKDDPAGFRLTSEELSELRRIRGHEAVNRNGETMREALAALFADPTFQSYRTREQKKDAVSEVLRGFNEDARAIFETRNRQYLADREANKALADYMAEGLNSDDAKQAVTSDNQALGLLAPSRLN